jgi:hypothetical protein
MTAGAVPSPPHLSFASVHRRGWSSLYAALRDRRADVEALRNLLAERRFEDGIGRARVYAVDVSTWPHCDAETSPERGY